jgi:hypothetical protein
MQLGVTYPVPRLNAPAVPHQSQQCIWSRAQAGEKEVLGLEWLAVAVPCGDDFNDPAGAEPGFTDVPRRIFRSHGPGDVSAMADLVVYCQKRDLAFSFELTLDMAMQRPLVSLDCQEEVGALLLELLKSGFWVCKASAWISNPWRSNSPSSVLSTARSWFSPAA